MKENFNQKKIIETNNEDRAAFSSKPAKIFLFFILTLPIFIGWIWYILKRNWFKRMNERMIEQISNIDAKLTERYNVLTNQLKVVKKALSHEKELQKEITNIRSKMSGPQPFKKSNINEKNSEINGLSARWNMLQENYPTISAMPVMTDINKSVVNLESDLDAQRRFYSSVARNFNSELFTFPSNVVATGMKLKRFPMFEAEDFKRKNVELNF